MTNHVFISRTSACPECGGAGETYRSVRWSGEAYGEYVSERCSDCGGSGKIERACEWCGGVTALNDEEYCRRCVERLTTPHDKDEQLTEVCGDPLLRRVA